MDSVHSPREPIVIPRWRGVLRRLTWLTLLAVIGGGLAAWRQPMLRHPLVVVSLVREKPAAQLSVPVEGVRARDVRDSWGAPRSGGRAHHGIDIFAKRGTPVVSATRGIVARVGTNRLGGQVVSVLGPGGEWHYYAHLDSYGRFVEGDVVRAGDVLGHVGDTGNAKGTPPHLHYGIYTWGGAVNPFPRLAPRPSTMRHRPTS